MSISEHQTPTRVILNFSHKCAMNCPWCYVPFGTQPAKKDVVESIVQQVHDLGFTSITIGGGDPFQYSFIESVIRKAKSLGLFVHVDTHARSMAQSESTFQLLAEAVDLLGLPLDGPNALMHDHMRTSPGHFDIVKRRLEWLGPFRERIKVNTVLSAVNALTMPALAALIAAIAPSRWSVYQYWPLGPASSVSATHSITNDAFTANTRGLRDFLSASVTSLEINSQESRRSTYPIVQHDGSMHVHLQAPFNDFRCIGSIFDNDATRKIQGACGGEREIAITRYQRRAV